MAPHHSGRRRSEFRAWTMGNICVTLSQRARRKNATMAEKLKPMHPGEVLREEFLVPLKMSAGGLAKKCGLPRTHIASAASEQTGITADTALLLAKALGTTARLWLNL